MIHPDEVFYIGRLGSTHGLKGDLTFRFTDDIFTSDECEYLVCDIDGLLVPFFLEDWRIRSSETAIVKFEGYDNVNAVQILQNADVYYPKAAVGNEQGELSSWKALTGFTVSDVKGGLLGTVTEVDDSSANTLLIVTPNPQCSMFNVQSPKDLVLPIHPDFIETLDINARTLQLRLPDGLLEL